MGDTSFYEEAVKQIKEELEFEQALCKKHGVTPEFVQGSMHGLSRALEILRLPMLSADEGYK
jgi:hypothetical protein